MSKIDRGTTLAALLAIMLFMPLYIYHQLPTKDGSGDHQLVGPPMAGRAAGINRRRRTVVFLTDRNGLHGQTDRHFYDLYSACFQIDAAHCVAAGPGLSSRWNLRHSNAENLKRNAETAELGLGDIIMDAHADPIGDKELYPGPAIVVSRQHECRLVYDQTQARLDDPHFVIRTAPPQLKPACGASFELFFCRLSRSLSLTLTKRCTFPLPTIRQTTFTWRQH